MAPARTIPRTKNLIMQGPQGSQRLVGSSLHSLALSPGQRELQPPSRTDVTTSQVPPRRLGPSRALGDGPMTREDLGGIRSRHWMRRGPTLCLGRIDTPASVVGIGQLEWAGSAARIERYVELSVLAVFADNCSRTVRLQRLQIDNE